MAEKIARNIAKVRIATAHPKRPGEECSAAAGVYRPVINIGKCEGKKDCAEVCPYDVFEITKIKPEDYAALGFFQKLKSKAHGGVVAYAVNADQCKACGLCVVACPEKSITLVKN